jgi:acyl carrier protein phosphodiesterase
MFPYMVNGNWLVNYANITGVDRTLSGMASRSPYDSKMEHAVSDLEKYYKEFNNEFDRFFPELKRFSEEWVGEG